MLEIKDKLAEIHKSFLNIEKEIAKPETVGDVKKYTKLMREYKRLKKIVDNYLEWDKLEREIADQKEMLSVEKDPELIDMIKAELPELEEKYMSDIADGVNAAKLGYVDDVIEPAQTRQILASALEMLSGKREARPAKKHGNMPL